MTGLTMRRILIICLVMLTFFCVGFTLPSRKGPKDFDYKTINLLKRNFKGGFLTAFHGDASMRGTIKQASYWLLEEESFKGKYLVSNSYQKKKEFILFCLLDYRQVKFGFKKQNDFTHRFYLKGGENIVIPIELGCLPKGAHDIIIALAEIPEKDHAKFYTDSIRTHRVNVFVESTSFPKLDLTLPNIVTEATYHALNLSLHNRNRNDLKRVSLSIGNNTKKDQNSLILLFNNFLQLEKGSRFLKIGQKQQVRMDFDLREDLKMMVCMKINNPYTVLEPTPTVLTTLDTSVESSNYLLPDKGNRNSRGQIPE